MKLENVYKGEKVNISKLRTKQINTEVEKRKKKNKLKLVVSTYEKS